MSRIYLPTERQYAWQYLNDYCLDKWGVVVMHYSNVKRVVENSCIDYQEI